MQERTSQNPPTDHADAAARHLIALAQDEDPALRTSPEPLGAAVALVEALAAALATSGGAR